MLAEANHQRTAAFIRGVDVSLEKDVTDLGALMSQAKGHHAAGKFDLDGDKAVIGADLAQTYGIGVGDKLTIYSPKGLEKLADKLKEIKGRNADQKQIDELNEMVAPVEVEVTGLFDSGRYQFDAQFIFLPLHLAQELYETEGAVHGVALRTDDPYHADAINDRLLDRLDARPAADLADVDRKERAVLRRHPHGSDDDVGDLRGGVGGRGVLRDEHAHHDHGAEDARDRHHEGRGRGRVAGVRVFLAQGVVVGAFGTVGGLGLALGVLALLNPFKDWMEWQFHVEVFSRKVYGLGAIPYWTKPEHAALICVGAFVFCSLAALIPAYFAARLDPVKALRFE